LRFQVKKARAKPRTQATCSITPLRFGRLLPSAALRLVPEGAGTTGLQTKPSRW
jgi:hypothetical protein